MKITLEPTDEGMTGDNATPTVIISIPGDSIGLSVLMETLIEPALMAIGFENAGMLLAQYYSEEP